MAILTLSRQSGSFGTQIAKALAETLKYRYLDLRRPSMQRSLRLRHKVCKSARDYFDERKPGW